MTGRVDTLNTGIPWEDMTAEQKAVFTAVLNQDLPKTDEQWLEYATSLSPIEYDRGRKAVAKRLGISPRTLDFEVENRRPKKLKGKSDGPETCLLSNPAPWPSRVDGASLAQSLFDLIRRYVVVPFEAATAIVLWTLHTYTLDCADASPILALTSPEKRCGKTIVLELLDALSFRSVTASNITPAALFRIIEADNPTLLIDEADSFLKEKEELRGILNSGHRRGTAHVIRTVGDNHDPKTFSTWCAKAIACIGKLPDTLEDRSINIRMRRKTRAEKTERIRYAALRAETEELRQKAVRWAKDSRPQLSGADPSMPETLNDRASDCWRPLIAIANNLGGPWPEMARTAAIAISGDLEDNSTTAQLLGDIREIFKQAGTDKLSSEQIVQELTKLHDRPWPEWKNGKPMSQTQLSRQLNRYEIKSKTIRLAANTTLKGYELGQFSDAFSRYLDTQSVTTSQPIPDASFSQSVKRNIDLAVTDSITSQTAPVVNCDGVTVSEDEIRI